MKKLFLIITIAFYGCNDEVKAPVDTLVITTPGVRNVGMSYEAIYLPAKKINITTEVLQKQIDYIDSLGYKVNIINKPMPNKMIYNDGCGTIYNTGTLEEYYDIFLKHIDIYINSSNEQVYNYLKFIIEKIESKQEWKKSQKPNPSLQKLKINKCFR